VAVRSASGQCLLAFDTIVFKLKLGAARNHKGIPRRLPLPKGCERRKYDWHQYVPGLLFVD
jgi:hypothetical protein